MDTRKTVARIIESEDPVEKILGGPESVGSRKEIDRSISEWSREFLVETKTVSGFSKYPNRVWVSAIPGKILDKFEEEFDDALTERTESIDDFVLAIYESNEAATMFRRAAVMEMDQIVLQEVEVDCPFECDVWLKRENNEVVEAPDVGNIKPERRR